MDIISELKESLARMGSDIKQKIIDSVKVTWKTINDFALSHRTTPQEVMQHEVDNVISNMSHDEDERYETGCEWTSYKDSLPACSYFINQCLWTCY